VEYYVDLLDAQDLVWASTSAADGSRSKPDPEPIRIALRRSGCDAAIVIGDSPWDCLAASAAGLPTATVLTGGFARSELEGAGAEAVYEHLGDLGDDLDRVGELVAQAG
jgi:phosphoglycolate phosphatase-like HAD superfamily hydrolase